MRAWRKLILLLLWATLSPWALAQQVLHLGLLAYQPTPQLENRWQALVEYLGSALPGYGFELRLLTLEQMNAAIRNNQLDFALTSPVHYIRLRESSAMTAVLATLARAENDAAAPVLGGVIIRRADRNDLRELADLRGKHVATPGPDHLGSFVAPILELSRQGIDRHDLHLSFLDDSNEKVVAAVLDGKADAGFIRTGLLENMLRQNQLVANQIEVINRQRLAGFPQVTSTHLFPEWPLIALPHVDQQLQRQIMLALLELKATDRAAQGMGIAGFNIPANYSSVEEAMRELRLSPFTDAPNFTWRDVWKRYQLSILISGLAALAIISLALRLGMSNRRLAAARIESDNNAAKLARESNILKTLVHTLPDMVWLKDSEGIYLACNPPFEAFFGASEAEIIGKSDCDFVDRELADAFRENDRQAMAANKARSNEEWITRASDGRQMLLETTKVPMVSTSGHAIGVLGVGHDITERKRTQEELEAHRNHLAELVHERTRELEEARNAAEAANHAKSSFLANMSHEIRTPLNAITGLAYVMKRDGLPPAQAERLNRIDHAGQHLLGVINDILDLSKIEAEKLSLEEIDFSVASLFANIISMMNDRALAKGLSLRVTPNLPQLNLRGDLTRLQQALLNYTSNAIKFTEAGTVTLDCQVIDSSETTALVRFAVCDTGVGIGPDEISRLFQPFEQADNSISRKYGGTGLGLAITRKLAMLMGGEAGAESVSGSGSTFWFTAVLHQADALPPPSRDPSEDKGPLELLSKHHRGKRILLVEDEPINREIGQELLADAGLAVDLAENGREAVERVEANRYALILMDMQMPEMDGLEATRQIRQQPNGTKVPILAMTANTFADDRNRCRDAGMDDFIAKPVDPKALYGCLLRWLSRSD